MIYNPWSSRIFNFSTLSKESLSLGLTLDHVVNQNRVLLKVHPGLKCLVSDRFYVK